MGNVLVHTEDEGVTLSAKAVKCLLDRSDGDAALLYLALLKHHGTIPPYILAEELQWNRLRIASAENTLQELGLIASSTLPKAPSDEKPVYQQSEIAECLEQDEEFQKLTAEVERQFGKKLTTPDIGVLLDLTDYLGMPPDVVYLLVCHCLERVQKKYGPGRYPGMKQISQEGYAWAHRGIDTQESAAAYLKEYAKQQALIPQYMRALQIWDRAPAPSEEKYLLSWQEMGFSPEAVSLAYDKTVLKCHEFKWSYCNGILKRWHKDDLHTLEEIQQKDVPKRKNMKLKATSKAAQAGLDGAWDYV